jgi:hypothetical protein
VHHYWECLLARTIIKTEKDKRHKPIKKSYLNMKAGNKNEGHPS